MKVRSGNSKSAVAGRVRVSKFVCGALLGLGAMTAIAGCQTTGGGDEAQSAAKSATGPAGSEVLSIESASPYSMKDLIEHPAAKGDVMLKAELVFPEGASETEKLPVMVYVHGSGGPLDRHQKWLRLFRDMGIATLQADHFAPRGVTSTVGDQSNVTGAMMTADALAILKALANHPRIDPNRIGIMGSSKGGGVATYVAWNPIRKAVSGDKAFAVHIPLYSTCAHWENMDFTGAPLLMMIGDQDRYTGVTQCVESIDAMRAAGYTAASVKLYPGAYHAFDDDRGVRQLSDGFSVTKCRFVVKADGETIEETSGLSMDNKSDRLSAFRRCATPGVTLGGNQVMPEAMKDVKAFVSKTLLK